MPRHVGSDKNVASSFLFWDRIASARDLDKRDALIATRPMAADPAKAQTTTVATTSFIRIPLGSFMKLSFEKKRTLGSGVQSFQFLGPDG
jgi:hypothetical protein